MATTATSPTPSSIVSEEKTATAETSPTPTSMVTEEKIATPATSPTPATSKVIEEMRPKAEVHYGAEICKEKVKEFLNLHEMPNGLLPLHDIDECGFVRETGYFWFKRKYKLEYKFENLDRLVSYASEVTGYAENKKFKKVTGIKTKELLMWITVNELTVSGDEKDDKKKSGSKITFKTPTGLYRSFPVSNFTIEE
ncbi:hypothetical protein MKW98_027435 [Papaver atlanticum]|uniref:Uncharacterized protein n=1 Tax=Papaver atlanticum TaxID=357466 RepID=A0AAD4THK0_9MAGN|nr:hypothetical protein MKW98_027435 [Papaver atlanticum]